MSMMVLLQSMVIGANGQTMDHAQDLVGVVSNTKRENVTVRGIGNVLCRI